MREPSYATTIKELDQWIQRAQIGDRCIYHTGRLGWDRLQDGDLNRRAATVLHKDRMGDFRSAQAPAKTRHRKEERHFDYYIIRCR